jgi:hypothetical protein
MSGNTFFMEQQVFCDCEQGFGPGDAAAGQKQSSLHLLTLDLITSSQEGSPQVQNLWLLYELHHHQSLIKQLGHLQTYSGFSCPVFLSPN